MKTPLRRLLPAAWLSALLATTLAPAGAVQPEPSGAGNKGGAPFAFGVIGHAFGNGSDAAPLRQAIRDADQAGLNFIVATGIKSATEPCSDKLYGQRRALLDESARPLVLSLAASDWGDCRNSLGRSQAIERLARLREVFFSDQQSLGQRKMPLLRLSAAAKFRSYAENAHWQSGPVLFATVNWPANNNHFLPEAGRNSEFEDRLVANRAWLHRLFALATRQKLDGVVLFSDGDVWTAGPPGGRQDGFAETRRQIKALAQRFPGKVLLIDAQGMARPAAISWEGNIGHMNVTADWAEVRVDPADAGLFTVKGGAN